LRAVSGFAQAVVEDYAPRLDNEGKRYLGLIQENAHKMGKLIDDLLTFSRLGRQHIKYSNINMDNLARTVFAELAGQISNSRIEVRKPPPARGDEAMIRQVLANLLGNAVKFTRNRQDPLIEFGYLPDVKGGAYYVRDNGVGFDMKYVDKLFGVFQRLHSASEFEGTGVGLALVHRIITRHGGDIWAEGRVDEGATFYFTLPEGEDA
jgi:two-component system sensor kinase